MASPETIALPDGYALAIVICETNIFEPNHQGL
jgi:hypothetical protein